MRQTENRSELQQRLDAELRAKAAAHKISDTPDTIDTSGAYLDGTKSTTSLAWLWVMIVMALMGLAIYFVVRTANQY